jgi:hypothetical protein
MPFLLKQLKMTTYPTKMRVPTTIRRNARNNHQSTVFWLNPLDRLRALA